MKLQNKSVLENAPFLPIKYMPSFFGGGIILNSLCIKYLVKTLLTFHLYNSVRVLVTQ